MDGLRFPSDVCGASLLRISTAEGIVRGIAFIVGLKTDFSSTRWEGGVIGFRVKSMSWSLMVWRRDVVEFCR